MHGYKCPINCTRTSGEEGTPGSDVHLVGLANLSSDWDREKFTRLESGWHDAGATNEFNEGTQLVGHRVFVKVFGEGTVMAFQKERFGASNHIIQFDHYPQAKSVKLRRKGNKETEWLHWPNTKSENRGLRLSNRSRSFTNLVGGLSKSSASLDGGSGSADHQQQQQQQQQQQPSSAAQAAGTNLPPLARVAPPSRAPLSNAH